MSKFSENINIPSWIKIVISKGNFKLNTNTKKFYLNCYINPEHWKLIRECKDITETNIARILNHDIVPNVVKYYISNDTKYISYPEYINVSHQYNNAFDLIVNSLDTKSFIIMSSVSKDYRTKFNDKRNISVELETYALTHITKGYKLYNSEYDILQYTINNDHVGLFKELKCPNCSKMIIEKNAFNIFQSVKDSFDSRAFLYACKLERYEMIDTLIHKFSDDYYVNSISIEFTVHRRDYKQQIINNVLRRILYDNAIIYLYGKNEISVDTVLIDRIVDIKYHRLCTKMCIFLQ